MRRWGKGQENYQNTDLKELTQKEHTLLNRMPQHGSFEEKHELLENSGFYAEWQQIFADYVSLVSIGDLEVVKRALFLLWYQHSKPHQLSGIKDLDENWLRKYCSS